MSLPPNDHIEHHPIISGDGRPKTKMLKIVDRMKNRVQHRHNNNEAKKSAAPIATDTTTTTAAAAASPADAAAAASPADSAAAASPADAAPDAASPADADADAADADADTATRAPTEAPEIHSHEQRSPRMHPGLLELYEVTDHVLGVGTFATVKEIKLRSTGQSFALKIILKTTLQGKVSMLDTEIAVLSRVRHRNCVSLLEMFETEDAVYLVTDLAEGGELFDELLKKGSYTEGDAARLVREILLGVEYLHSMGIVHRDLKPENLLFLDKSENARLMITDFGLSKMLTSGNDVLMTACGTPGYVAPEVLEGIGHGRPVDMWGVGIIAYTLLCGYPPFWGEDQLALFKNIVAGKYAYEEQFWEKVSPLAKDFIDTLLVRPAEKRPTATQALAHSWFSTMLDRDEQTTTLPRSGSVDLLPGVRKNINARNVFKKAVRVVGILRRIHAASQQHPTTAPELSPLRGEGASDGRETRDMVPNGGAACTQDGRVRIGGTSRRARPNPMGLSLHDVVSLAMMAKQRKSLDAPSSEGEQPHRAAVSRDDSEVYLEKMDAALEGLTRGF
ncbi:hypothetical protein BGZ65_011235 [Modicella reniformis]|uniref:Protein kinase domain-containing protein n=1 Tax=Modicella reniformis TaxID=1440133 RepID=A0A9P6IMF7_9FUNG|nr:hypothetical protein BGZ65_011235 [Modicella reniformis]